MPVAVSPITGLIKLPIGKNVQETYKSVKRIVDESGSGILPGLFPCLGCFIEQSRGFTGSGNKIYRTEGGRAYGDVSESRGIFPGNACPI